MVEVRKEFVYRDGARFYDAIYHWKDYDAEAARLHELLRTAGIPDGASVLEAACGTGAHMAALRATYDVAGFDRSTAMLEVARERFSDVSLRQADMTSFTVDAPVDALLCLFSSIGYLEPERALPAAAARFAAAVHSGGALIVEPWLAPDAFEPGRQIMQTYDGDAMKLSRMVVTERDGDQAIFDFHWLVIEAGVPTVRHIVDRHVLWLVPRDRMLAVFDEAGFDGRWEPDGLMPGRELLVGRRR